MSDKYNKKTNLRRAKKQTYKNTCQPTKLIKYTRKVAIKLITSELYYFHCNYCNQYHVDKVPIAELMADCTQY